MRDPRDAYYTEPPLAAASIAWAAALMRPEWRPQTVVEPCTGGAAFLDAMLARWPGAHPIGCDGDPRAPSRARHDLEVYAHDLEEGTLQSVLLKTRPGSAMMIATNPHYKGLSDTVAILVDLQRQLAERQIYAPLLLLLRETALSHLCAGPTPPTDLGLTPIRPRWGGPGGEALLAEARQRAEEESREKREKRAADYRAKADAIARQRMAKGKTDQTKEQIRLLEAAERALRPPVVSSPSADNCGSALALWRPPIPGRTWERRWHPIPPWRAVGGDDAQE